MPIITTGRRSHGSGKKPCAESIALRELIIKILLRKSMISMFDLRREVSRYMSLKGEALKQNMHSLIISGDVISERRNSRYCMYSAADPRTRCKIIVSPTLNQPKAKNVVKYVEGYPYIKHVYADQLPKLSGPIYSPMVWIVHQLQGV